MSMVRKRRVKLTYPSSLLDEPILYRLITQFDVVVNVVEASVTSERGWFILDMEGSAAALVQARHWLAQQGLQVEDVPRA
ncbi:MAG: NIL domain-containing protein [Chloroflexi bacterium]|nr:NIL domain-containing protein [Chloroflexota bacterium]